MKLLAIAVNRIKHKVVSYSLSVDPARTGRQQTFTLFPDELPLEFGLLIKNLKQAAMLRLGVSQSWDVEKVTLRRVTFTEIADGGSYFTCQLDFSSVQYSGYTKVTTPAVWIMPPEGPFSPSASTELEYTAILKMREIAPVFVERSLKGLALAS